MPEIASRHHLRAGQRGRRRRAGAGGRGARRRRSLVAVTQGPGLVGALLVGVATAKALAAARRLPLAPVDHLQGHVAATYLEPEPMEPPFLCLLASGGHTLLARVTEPGGYEVLGRTLDDAAGEAFDKGARLLGLPYPGGPALSKLAAEGDPAAFAFPTRGARRRASTSPSRASRPRCSTRCATWGRRRRARRARRPRRLLRGTRSSTALILRVERALARRAGRAARARRRRGGEPAAARARRRAGRRAEGPAVRALHRQRGDDRLGRALGRAAARTRTTSTWTPTRPRQAA